MPQMPQMPTITAPASLEQVTDAQLARYATLIYDHAGIVVSPQKKSLLSNRLRRRLRATGIPTFEKYYEHLRRLPKSDAEWHAFIQEITTHETYLFRDDMHWNWFGDVYLDEVLVAARAKRRPRSLRIWSAAASTGDESYTAAICILENLSNCSGWNLEIFGTDIGIGAIEQAKRGCFGERAMRLVSDNLRRKFFVQTPGQPEWTAKPALRDLMRFSRHNLLDPVKRSDFDVVFLKNVLIYFDGTSKQTVLDNVSASIASGGYLVSGAAEGISDRLTGFERIQPWLHRRL